MSGAVNQITARFLVVYSLVLLQANIGHTPQCATRQSVYTRLAYSNVSSVMSSSFTACHKMSDIVALIQGTSASYLNVTATYKPANDT